MQAQPTTREMQRAFMIKDASYDGIFCVGVKTTGIFCRPSCPARRPKPENVEFFTTTGAALFSGFRPCKRCRPLDASGAPPRWVAKLKEHLERSETKRVTAEEMRRIGIDPARARRYFQKNHGMTFNAFARAWRLNEAFRKLRTGSTVEGTAAEVGFESESGFRAALARVLGTTPSGARERNVVTLSWTETPLGPMLAGSTEDAICFLEFSDRRMLETQLKTLARRLNAVPIPGTNDLLLRLREQLGEYFARQRREFDLPLLFPGTPFQDRVWSALREIPYGSTRSYAEIARQIGHPDARRAVGTANGMNRLAILIPCHRVVNASGQLGGYGGGLWRKRLLLDLEQQVRPETARLRA